MNDKPNASFRVTISNILVPPLFSSQARPQQIDMKKLTSSQIKQGKVIDNKSDHYQQHEQSQQSHIFLLSKSKQVHQDVSLDYDNISVNRQESHKFNTPPSFFRKKKSHQKAKGSPSPVNAIEKLQIIEKIKQQCLMKHFKKLGIEKTEEETNEISTQNTSRVKNAIYLQPSIFEGRPATVLFLYPPICEKQNDLSKAQKLDAKQEKMYDLSYLAFGSNPYTCVTKTFEFNGFKRIQDEEEENQEIWNVLWGMADQEVRKKLIGKQKINHFPGCNHLGRKDFLWRNLSKLKRKFPTDYDFVPNTYLLAYDYDRFEYVQELAEKNKLWIMKPVASCKGQGIKMISRKSKVPRNKNYLIMDYISNPHLINGLKYDLRVYVVVTSFNPLKIYLYNEGLVRFATQIYSTNIKDLKKKYIHLTNFSVNKNAPNYVKNKNSNVDGEGSKWSHSALKKKYRELGIDVETLFSKIKDVIVKTIISSETSMLDMNSRSFKYRNSFFELYGFDILIDDNLKPWVLEVNVSPSLNSSAPLDRKIKTSLIVDILNLIGVVPFNKTKKKKQNEQPVNPSKKVEIIHRNVLDIQDLDDKNCIFKLNHNDWKMLLESFEEFSRCNNMERIFPNLNSGQYHQFFEISRYNDFVLSKAIEYNFLMPIFTKN